MQVVLRNAGIKVSTEEIEALFDELETSDFDRIEKAALDSGTSLEDQTDGTQDELLTILIEKDVICPGDITACEVEETTSPSGFSYP